MSFIIRNDLNNTLNEADITVLAPDEITLLSSIKRAIEEVKSYIQHRYDVDLIFTDVSIYDNSDTYVVDDVVYFDEKYYINILESTGNLPSNTTYFTEISDPRDQAILDITCIISIFYLFRRKTPRTTPPWIISEYDRVRDDLKAYQKGIRTILLPVNEDEDGDEEGHRITYSSETQKDWRM